MKKNDSITVMMQALLPAVSVLPSEADTASQTVSANATELPKSSTPAKPKGMTPPVGTVGAGSEVPVVMTKKKNVPVESDTSASGEAIGDLSEDSSISTASHVIAGRSDRAHYLALAAALGRPNLQPPKANRQNAQPSIIKLNTSAAVKPRSRSECEGRCGANGFCDPLSELGCGGRYCGHTTQV